MEPLFEERLDRALKNLRWIFELKKIFKIPGKIWQNSRRIHKENMQNSWENLAKFLKGS